MLFCVSVKIGLSHQGYLDGQRMFESKALKRIFGPNTEEVTGGMEKSVY